MGDREEAQDLHADARPLGVEASVVRALGLGRQLEPLLELRRAPTNATATPEIVGTKASSRNRTSMSVLRSCVVCS